MPFIFSCHERDVSATRRCSNVRPSWYMPFASSAEAPRERIGLGEVDLLDERAGRVERPLERRVLRIRVRCERVNRPARYITLLPDELSTGTCGRVWAAAPDASRTAIATAAEKLARKA